VAKWATATIAAMAALLTSDQNAGDHLDHLTPASMIPST
jgi:hypothetical protein